MSLEDEIWRLMNLREAASSHRPTVVSTVMSGSTRLDSMAPGVPQRMLRSSSNASGASGFPVEEAASRGIGVATTGVESQFAATDIAPFA